jgi:hypothetical protein
MARSIVDVPPIYHRTSSNDLFPLDLVPVLVAMAVNPELLTPVKRLLSV